MRTINAVRNCHWVDFAQTQIDMEVDFDEEDEQFVPFTAMASDPESWGRDLWTRANAGEFGPIAAYSPPSDITGDAALSKLRGARNALLEETDYIEMPTKWATLTSEQQSAWATYRNALRDLPQDYPNVSYVYDEQGQGSWSNVTFPTKPE